jgi:hypothetical protein
MKIVSSKLNELQDGLNLVKKDTMENKVSFARVIEKMSDINVKLDREAAQKGEMKTLKDRMLQQVSFQKAVKDLCKGKRTYEVYQRS